VRERRAQRNEAKNLIDYAAAQANPTPIDWGSYTPTTPIQPGITVLDDIDLRQLLPYIDWTFFFHAWQLKGRFPAILQDTDKGEEAAKLYADAEAMLEQLIQEGWLRAKAVVGLFPANAIGDDVELKDADGQSLRLHFLRKQGRKPAGRYNESLADFIAPADSGKQDYIGGFAATAGIGIDEKVAEFERDHDVYSSLMLKALADRLAEAMAEWLHEKVRRELWGYAEDESLSNEDLISEGYQGIRPAMGYPASPDHTEKDILWRLLDAQANTGIWLTESKAMVPTAAVSGLYFAHPDARYFAVGKIQQDQVADYAARKGVSVDEMEKWLGPNLAYK